MGNLKKHARIYDRKQMPDQNETQIISKERMRERNKRLKEQRQNDTNQPIMQLIERNTGNY